MKHLGKYLDTTINIVLLIAPIINQHLFAMLISLQTISVIYSSIFQYICLKLTVVLHTFSFIKHQFQRLDSSCKTWIVSVHKLQKLPYTIILVY